MVIRSLEIDLSTHKLSVVFLNLFMVSILGAMIYLSLVNKSYSLLMMPIISSPLLLYILWYSFLIVFRANIYMISAEGLYTEDRIIAWRDIKSAVMPLWASLYIKLTLSNGKTILLMNQKDYYEQSLRLPNIKTYYFERILNHLSAFKSDDD